MPEYKQRDTRALGENFARHMSAMTAERLHKKADIAAELAWRDNEIDRLKAEIKTMRPDLGFYDDDCK